MSEIIHLVVLRRKTDGLPCGFGYMNIWPMRSIHGAYSLGNSLCTGNGLPAFEVRDEEPIATLGISKCTDDVSVDIIFNVDIEDLP